ncbi:hypothetical protein [Halomonas sp. BM-2019]|uniref:hypothetical protein n=1 Tax=Halomonas sp. BM-2019 TaxID=2811227 RepID=UPI001B3C2EB4|nr:MAG: hypothetical protein J5F18_12580 [Halomonas sp. BM-2019]
MAWNHLYWSATLLRKFFVISPWPTLSVVSLTLLSQGAKLFAFFLPLKVIILIGSTGVPRYFPSSWESYEKDTLVLALSFSAVIFFLIHFFSDKLLSSTAEGGAAGVVEQTRKLPLFSNQDDLASSAYRRLAAGLATSVMALALGLLFGLVYPSLLLAIVVYFMIATIPIGILGAVGDKWQIFIIDNQKEIVGFFFGAGFLYVFSFMVADFLIGGGPGFMVAIISLLLSRQFLNRAQKSVRDAIWLSGKKYHINAIFFSKHKLDKTKLERRDKVFTSFFHLPDRPDLLLDILRECNPEGQHDECEITCRWHQGGQKGILLFYVDVVNHSSVIESYLLKVFDVALDNQAAHELELLTSSLASRLPSLSLAGASQREGCSLHLFFCANRDVVDSKGFAKGESRFYAACWGVKPSKKVVSRYLRSHPLIHQRLQPYMIERLFRVLKNSERGAVPGILSDHLEEIVECLASLPVVFVNPDIKREMVCSSANDKIEIAHWGRWSLEPAGSGFPIRKGWHGNIKSAFESACEHRKDFTPALLPLVRLSAYCSLFEKYYHQQRFADAADLIPKMVSCLPSQSSGNKLQANC